MHVMIELQNSNRFTKKNKQILTSLQPQSNKPLVYKLQSVHSKQNHKQISHESNKSRMLQTGGKIH